MFPDISIGVRGIGTKAQSLTIAFASVDAISDKGYSSVYIMLDANNYD